MKIAAHTMGTPELSPYEAVNLFASMGYQGIEFVSREDYKCGPTIHWSQAERTRLKSYCNENGLPIVCLAAYMTDINTEIKAKAEEQMALVRESIILAHDIGAPVVRLYGGRLVTKEQWESSAQILVERLCSVVELCRELGVRIGLENHFGTLTTTASETIKIVKAVGAPEVGVVYDQANIAYEHGECYEKAIDLQAGYLLHVHAKDLIFIEGATESDVSEVTHLSYEKRIARWVLLGKGILPWKEILRYLAKLGYNSYISVEYTNKKAYEGELPDPEIGMKHSLHYLKELLQYIN